MEDNKSLVITEAQMEDLKSFYKELKGKPVAPEETKPAQEEVAPTTAKETKPLIYFSSPISEQSPQWATALHENLLKFGYLVFNPWLKITEQLTEGSVTHLDNCSNKLVPALCQVLKINENVLHPFKVVAPTFNKADNNQEADCIVFRNQWFITRSSLMICDLTTTTAGIEIGQDLLYCKLLGIPTIGILPESGKIQSPLLPQCTTVFFNASSSFGSIFPLISGFAPV